MFAFETYAYVVLAYMVVAPVLPWLIARKWGAGRAWSATAIVLLLLVVLNAALWPACIAANCGQGAIVIVALWGLAGISGLCTLAVGGLVAYFRR